MKIGSRFRALASVFGALLIWALMGSQAMASVAACYRLAVVVSPSDFKTAYTFVTQHGQCLADFDDPAFDGVAAGLTGLEVAGVTTPATCTTILNDINSPAVQTLEETVPDVNVITEYLTCGCAVADSGIAEKIKSIISDMKSCASAFDPSAVIESGLNAAGTALGFSTLWGLENDNSNRLAGVGNAGAPQTAYATIPTCQIGVSMTAQRYADGHYYPWCACPAPTMTLNNGQPQDWDAPLAGNTFSCAAPCDPGQAVQNGVCKPCPNLGPNTSNVPDPSRTSCIQSGTGQVIVPKNTCQQGQKWNGGSGGTNVCCNADQKIVTVAGHDQCLAICQDYQSYQGGKCVNKCTLDRVWQDGTCQLCPANKQVNGYNGCNACPAGTTAIPGHACTATAPLPQCFGNQINPPSNPYQCAACPTGTFPNSQRNACFSFTCGGDTVPSATHANTCTVCDKGYAPNPQHTACVPVGLPRLVVPGPGIVPRRPQ